ncbi:hypothetical protein D3C72_2390420 [compost metagenome]
MERSDSIGADSSSRACCCVSAAVPRDEVIGFVRLLWVDVDLYNLCLRDNFSGIRYLSLPMRRNVQKDGLEKTFKS